MPTIGSQRCKGGVAVNQKEEILALDDKRFGAMIGRDFKALQAMVHDDLLYTHSSGGDRHESLARTYHEIA
jgi:hypothetical protein